MSAQHTPERWFVAEYHGHMTGIRADDPNTGRWLAVTWCQTSQPSSREAHARQVKENESNARRIAALPALLAAAREAESMLPHLCDPDTDETTARVLADLRAAIAAAMGHS